jgi:hypothetical protein
MQSYSNHTPSTANSWFGMDSEELYLSNRQHRSDLLRQHGWWDYEHMDYRFNSHGFRSVEFTNNPGTLFLGCSFTLGVGVAVEDTWAHRVSRALGTACWNLGQGGGSMDTCFRLAEHWVPRLRPVRVVLLAPPVDRWELIDSDGLPKRFSAHDSNNPISRKWLAHPENARLNHLRNRWAIRALCHSQSLPFSEWPHTSLGVHGSLGRDLAHPGIEAHRQFADTVLSHIQSAENIQ